MDELDPRGVAESRCVACGKSFRCGAAAGDGRCWCEALPRVLKPDPAVSGCYCPLCLRERLSAQGQDPA